MLILSFLKMYNFHNICTHSYYILSIDLCYDEGNAKISRLKLWKYQITCNNYTTVKKLLNMTYNDKTLNKLFLFLSWNRYLYNPYYIILKSTQVLIIRMVFKFKYIQITIHSNLNNSNYIYLINLNLYPLFPIEY